MSNNQNFAKKIILEFLDTFVHELRHLTDSVAKSMDVALDSEEAAYFSGDTARELADVVCKLACR